jgi:hypothetical protein
MTTGWHRRRTPKPKTAAAGYGAAHKRERARWLALLERTGTLPCTRCTRPVIHGQRVELDHCDDCRRTGASGCPRCHAGYLGLAHRLCNGSAGARTAARNRNGYRSRRYPAR